MSKISDELLNEIRVFRHNYVKFQHYGTSQPAKKARESLKKISKLSSLLSKELWSEMNALGITETSKLDELLHIAEIKQKKGK